MSEREQKKYDDDNANHFRRDGLIIYAAVLELQQRVEKQTEILEKLLKQQQELP